MQQYPVKICTCDLWSQIRGCTESATPPPHIRNVKRNDCTAVTKSKPKMIDVKLIKTKIKRKLTLRTFSLVLYVEISWSYLCMETLKIIL